MKKWIPCVLAILLVCVFPACSFAGEENETEEVLSSGEWEYYLNDDGTVTITAWTGEDEGLIVPEAIDGLQVTIIGENAFYLRENLKKIEIPKSVTEIGKYAFCDCDNLKSIKIPKSVTKIGEYAFLRCDNLEDFVVSSDNKNYAVKDKALFEKKTRTLICYPSGLPDTEYAISEGVAGIGAGAFFDCPSLERVEIPESVKEIGEGPFLSCDSLTSIIMSPENDNYAVMDNVLFEKKTKTLVCYPAGLTNSSYAIPEGITTIKDYAFALCNNLEDIIIPESVTEIGEFAFYECGSLMDIKIPKSVTEIGIEAFCGCRYLTSIEIPNLVTKIRARTFARCYTLTDVVISESVTEIGEWAFYKCVDLARIEIPKSVTKIGEGAFYDCDNMKMIVEKDSYAAQYAKENDIPYQYTDANDWLND